MPHIDNGADRGLGIAYVAWLDDQDANHWHERAASTHAIFAAGWSAALASLVRYRAHLEERRREAEEARDVPLYAAMSLAWSEVRNVELWIEEGMACRIEGHKGCRAGRKDD